MGSLAENLDPPFYAAVLNETNRPGVGEDDLAPADEMNSLAPHQPGFLGLETTRTGNGAWVSVTYWTTPEAIKAWEETGDRHIRNRFDGTGLRDTCGIRISKIDEKIGSDRSLRAETPAIPASSVGTLSLGLLATFPAIASLLGIEHVG